jgi:catechol 2,3-dioxygenase-like lactoylglutathione lyase family enzyme
MASVQGIGGVFIDSTDAARLAAWYQDSLGVTLQDYPEAASYFCVFTTRDAVSGILRENPVFAINQAKEPLAATGRGFTLNLRVDDLDAFLEQLRAKGVTNEGEMLAWERGKHAWIHDLDGNRIELYEELLVDEAA